MEQRIALKDKTIIVLTDKDSSAESRFIIDNQIGSGGSCLVYSVKRLRGNSNEAAGRSLILKECFPANSGAVRTDDGFIEFPDDETRDTAIKQFNAAYDKAEEFYDLLDGKQILVPSVKELYGNGTVYRLLINEGGHDLLYTREEERTNGFSQKETVQIMQSLCSVANRLHEKGYYYLDYKPENIYLKEDDSKHIYLFDFDSILSDQEISEHPEDISCTFRWAPPELYPYLDPDRISARTDIYELGEIFLWLLTFKEPNAKDKNSSFEDRLADIRENNPFSVSTEANDQILHILEHTLVEDEENRFGTVEELSEEFTKLGNMLEGAEDNPTLSGKADEIIQSGKDQSEALDTISKGQKTNKKLLIAIAAMLVGVICMVLYSILPNFELFQEPELDSLSQTWGRMEISGYSEEIAEYNESIGFPVDPVLITIEASLRRAPKYEEQVFADYDNEQIRFRVHYRNQTGEKKSNIHIRTILPTGIEYEEGSTTIYNSTNPDGLAVSDNIIKNSGVNIGTYNDGGGVWIYFNAVINPDKISEGNTILRSVIQVSDGSGTIENKADVIVSKSPVSLLKSCIFKNTDVSSTDELTIDAGDEFYARMYMDNSADESIENVSFKAVIPEGFEYVPHTAEVSLINDKNEKKTARISDVIFTEGFKVESFVPNSNIQFTYKVRATDSLKAGSKHTIASVADIGEQTLRDNVYIFIND